MSLTLFFFCFFCGSFQADRILAVNGKSLEYVSHDEAVQTLKNAPVEVELLVSQSTRTEGDIGKWFQVVKTSGTLSNVQKNTIYMYMLFTKNGQVRKS